jgi:hypothetical protein
MVDAWRPSCFGERMSPSVVFSLVAACVPLLACHPYGPELPRHPDVPIPENRVMARGVVVSVERPRPEDSQSYVHVVISDEGRRPVRLILGPGWFLDREGIHFEPNQVVRAEGRRSTETEGGIVVESVSSGDKTYQLRDEQHRPAWQR